MADLRVIKNGGKLDFKTYNRTECRKSFCRTNKTRKSIHYDKWMIKGAEDQKYIIINKFEVFQGLPIICKQNMTINSIDENNRVFWEPRFRL